MNCLCIDIPWLTGPGALCGTEVTELGMRQHCRDNVTMFSGKKWLNIGIVTIFVGNIPFRLRGLYTFFVFFLVTEALHIVLSWSQS